MKRIAITILACAALTPAVSAQEINVDFGSHFGVPSDSYGAASGQAGVWNGLESTSFQVELIDIHGNETNAELTDNGGNFTFWQDDPDTSGDDEALLDDLLDLGPDFAVDVFTVTGLEAGAYTIYTYNIAPDNFWYYTNVWVNGSEPQLIGGEWNGDFVAGVTHGEFDITIAEGEDLVIDTEVFFGYGTFSGLQIVPACPGDIDPDGVVDPGDLAVVLGNWGACPETSGCGDCDEEHDAGCSDAECEFIVCDMDPFCCDTAWDVQCMVEARNNCDCLGAPCSGDLNGDDIVGPADLAVVLGNWGPCQN